MRSRRLARRSIALGGSTPGHAAARCADLPRPGARVKRGAQPTAMAKRVAVLISGRGSNMAALIYAARTADCPYQVALVTGDRPDAPGLALAEAEGVAIKRLGFEKG